MKFRIYCAISLDGFIADNNGCVRWLQRFPHAEYGYGAFLTSIKTVVMGRKCYELARSTEPCEYLGKQSIVLTSQTLTNLPPDVDTTPGPVRTLAADLRKNAKGDVWIKGGAQIIGAFLDARAVDTMELYTIPVVLGHGVALFTRTGTPAHAKLLEVQQFENGMVRSLYEPERE